MKPRRRVILFSVGVLLLLAGLVSMLFWKKPPPRQPDSVSGQPASAQSARTIPSGSNSSLSPGTRGRGAAAVQNLAAEPATETNQERSPGIRSQYGAINHQAVSFYGQALDQDGNPVSAAEVSASLSSHDGYKESNRTLQTTTDAYGHFKFEGLKGSSLGVRVSKSGYRMMMTNTHFVYSYFWPAERRHVAIPETPVVFKMWKLRGAEPLIKINQRHRFSPSEGTIILDLVEGKRVASGGDLMVTVKRGSGTANKRTPVAWSIEFAAVSGGLIESTRQENDVTFAAPSTGYAPKLAASMDPTDPAWKQSIRKSVIFQSRNAAVFGKFDVYCLLNEKSDGLIDLEISNGLANTNGSRNLETFK